LQSFYRDYNGSQRNKKRRRRKRRRRKRRKRNPLLMRSHFNIFTTVDSFQYLFKFVKHPKNV